MKRIILSLIIVVFACGLIFAGSLHFGMPSAVKSKVEELDKKVKEKKLERLERLVLKGNFGGVFGSSFRSFSEEHPITKIVLVTIDSFRIVDITGDNFSIDIANERNTPVGIIFIDNSDQMAGCLQFVATSTDTLNLLPLTKLKEGTQEIDLEKISFSEDAEGNIAISTYDPVGENKEISFSETEKKAAAKMTKILANILKNPDVNGNGTIDFLENKYFILNIQYHLNAGEIPAGGSDGQYDATVFSIANLNGFYTQCLIYPDYMNEENRFPLTFPSSYLWTHGNYTGNNNNDDYTQNNGSPEGGTAFPVDGNYIVDAGAVGCANLTFRVTGQQDAVDNLIIPFPRYYISGGNLRKITWEWKLRNDINGQSIDPRAFINDMSIQVNNSSLQRTYNSYGGGATYEWVGVNLTGAEGEHVIGVNNLNWTTDCDGRIDFGYNDAFGNHVVVQFEKPSP